MVVAWIPDIRRGNKFANMYMRARGVYEGAERGRCATETI